MMGKIINFFGNKHYTQLRWRLLLAVMAIVIIADFLVERHHSEHFWDAIPGWGAIFGFFSCTVIIFVSKFIGHKCGIMKDEDYYD